jgi:diguanylate cyclase (GGDEF)-like protein
MSSAEPTGTEIPKPQDRTVAPERGERRRTQQFQMLAATYASYCIDSGLLYVLFLDRAVGWNAPLLDFLGGSFICGTAFLVFKSGRSQRLADPYFAGPQTIMSLALQLTIALIAPAVALLILPIIFIVFAFAALRLRPNTVFMMWGTVSVGIVILLTISRDTVGMPHGDVLQAVVSGLWLSLILGRCAFVGLYGAQVRQQLGVRNRQLTVAQDHLETLANRDGLTGALNRRAIWNLLLAHLARPLDPNQRVAVILADLDHFKDINDRYGHLIGDTVLRRFVLLTGFALRGSDRVGRYGGEEFLIVLASVGDANAPIVVAERIRETVVADAWESIAASLRVTASLGVAIAEPGESAEDLVARADAAMYKAKSAGRNQVIA